MRRLFITAALLASASAIAPAAASAAPASAIGSARVVSCESALNPADRLAGFEGRMRTVRGTGKMQMRFTLQTRSKDEPDWHAVPAPGFGRWLTSDAGVGR